MKMAKFCRAFVELINLKPGRHHYIFFFTLNLSLSLSLTLFLSLHIVCKIKILDKVLEYMPKSYS